ncbi:Predicted regulator of Ras-like GTPase activity, Roadblock/LC7/MglB family [Saccharopolyspora shandongensis]|uniref:Predicted regulator of Ras-like GTPase activity, Roadblock/LC7/MglB family n=1 Tax=Saccharopolyspora shandongensis TaxID=418495 RepID=A0A1H3G661_9PSEU|nr:roadblock/LC7 domain-containing protein [Saccharopolyspora shandongensis]SDX98751.1 Predicted regulator of Ras-like GTPase activity, Roadblock/LC7/MglB family [Saccharopolyspora shandongensis]
MMDHDTTSPANYVHELLRKVPKARCGLVASRDGLAITAVNLDSTSAARLSATVSAIFSLVGQAAVEAGDGGGGDVHQLHAEVSNSILSIVGAEGSVLAVLSDLEVNRKVLGFEMRKLVKALPEQMSTPPRMTTPPTTLSAG